MIQETEVLYVEISLVMHLLLLSTVWVICCVPVEVYEHVPIIPPSQLFNDLISTFADNVHE